MPRKTVTASVGGILVGIAITTAVNHGIVEQDHIGDGILLPALIHIAPTLGCTVVGVTLLRRWLDTYTAQTKKELDQAAEQRQISVDQIHMHLEEITRREEALNRSSRARDAQLIEALRTVDDERKARIRLQRENDELVADFNRVVTDSLQQSANLFRPRPDSHTVTDARCIPMPARPRHDGDVAHHQTRDVADPLLLN